MRIQNNISAINTNRMIFGNNAAISKNVEKLSSGFRVNRAADDAAGLAISEKMRTQIRGLNRASMNSQDGISLVQTAEGGMQGAHNVLQRMRELAVQSANGTNDDPVDRQALELEFQQLFREIDDIARTTTFNNIRLLDGTHTSAAANSASVAASNASVDERIILGEGSSLSGIPATSTATGTAGINWSNIGGKDLTWLRDSIADDIAPSSVHSILTSINDAVGFLSGSSIGIGMSHSSLPGAAAAVGWSFGIQDGNHFIDLRLVFDTGYLASVTNASGGFTSAQAQNEFYSIVAHEMMHAVMAVANTYGMSSISGDGFQSSQFPIWFREGMAQAVSGPIGWLNSLGPSPTDAQINNYMSSLPTGTSSSSGQGMYGAGYVAAMYLGHVVGGGTGTPNSTTIGNGLEIIMREITAGMSLDQAIAEHTGGRFTGLADFQNQLRTPGADSGIHDFVRGLISETGTGAGSILGPLGMSMTDILAGAPNTEGFLNVTVNNSIVSNAYPPGYTVIAGGGATITGNPIGPGAPTPLRPIIGSAQEPPTVIITGGGGYSTFILQVGANEADTLAVHIGSISTMALGMTGSSIASQESARDSMTTVTDAINSVSLSRASLGAYQNRLEFKIHNLDNSAENLSASESRIRDVDMAKMMTEFTRNNILFHASIAMLSQANAIPQGVLQLVS